MGYLNRHMEYMAFLANRNITWAGKSLCARQNACDRSSDSGEKDAHRKESIYVEQSSYSRKNLKT